MANDCESVGSIKDDYRIIVPKVTKYWNALECISQFSKAEIFKLLKKAIYFVQEKHYIKLK